MIKRVISCSVLVLLFIVLLSSCVNKKPDDYDIEQAKSAINKYFRYYLFFVIPSLDEIEYKGYSEKTEKGEFYIDIDLKEEYPEAYEDEESVDMTTQLKGTYYVSKNDSLYVVYDQDGNKLCSYMGSNE